MVITRFDRIDIRQLFEINVVDNLTYLGCQISNEGESLKDIKH